MERSEIWSEAKRFAMTYGKSTEKGSSVTEELATIESDKPAKRFQRLAEMLKACANSGVLFKLASSADFKAITTTLPPAELKALREIYRQRKSDVDGRTRLDEFDGDIITITDILFWKTEKFLDKNPSGNGVTLTYSPESNPTRVCRSMTSSATVYRFARSACSPTPPTAADPVRAHIELLPVSDPARAAEGQKQWHFRLLPTTTRDNGEEGSPF